MFGSTILDVAIGIVFAFLGVSLASSAITEAISSAMTWRENTLVAGVKALLNDPKFTGVALELYNQALINPLASGVARSEAELTHKPAYIDGRHFALAFYGLLSKGGAGPADFIATISDAQLKTAMQTLWHEANGEVTAFKRNIATWFDTSMDRVSGWYKRRTQLVSFLVALAVAILFNVNALYEGAQIWTRPGVIASVEAHAADAGKGTGFDQLQPAFLIGWVDGPTPHDTAAWFIAVASWLIVAGASLFGASFWFDILQRLTQLRGTGRVPPKSDGTRPN